MRALLHAAESHALNIRSFKPNAMKGHKLIQNIKSASEAASAHLASEPAPVFSQS